MKIFSKAIFFLFLFASPLFAFDLEGRVKLDPPLPEARSIEVAKEHQAECGSKKLSPKLKVSPEGFVANAVIKVEGMVPTSGQLPAEKDFVLDQIDCEFKPHVVLLSRGANLSILNSDGFLHNVRAFDEKTEMLFNDAMPKKGQVLRKRFDKPGRIIFRCGVHPWMHALVIVKEHPFYALTDETGYFKIAGIPEGNYTVSVWHEELGELKTQVDSKTQPLTLTYPVKSAS